MNSPILAVIILMASSFAYAEQDANTLNQYFGEFPVVLTASRLVQPVEEAPAAVTVLDRETIRMSGSRRIAELFRLVPGFLVTYVNGHSPVVTYHGLSDIYARRLQVMIDGVSVYSPLWGGVEWNELPIGIDDIERIEIVRGPNGASFGANAFVGMVNIITREPTASAATGVSMNGGQNGIGDWSLRHAAGQGDTRYRISIGHHSDRGYDIPADSSHVTHLSLRSHHQLDARNELMGTLSHASGYGQEDRVARPFESEDIQLRWTNAVSAERESWLQFHHARRRTRQEALVLFPANLSSFGGPNLGMLPINVNFNNDVTRDEVEFQQSFGVADGWQFVWGGQWRVDAVRSQALFNQPGWLSNQLRRLFGSAEWRPTNEILFHAGATHERSSMTGESLSPRLSVTLLSGDGQSVRLGISRARRTPTLIEESSKQSYPTPAVLHNALVRLAPLLRSPYNQTVLSPVLRRLIVSSGGLTDEKILSREVAYLGRISSLRLSGEVRWFSDQVRDLIYTYQVPFATALNPWDNYKDVRNRDIATVRGSEGSLRYSPWHGGDLLVAAGRTVIHSSAFDADYHRTAPVHTSSALFQQRLPWNTTVSAAFYRVGSMKWLSDGSELPSYDRIDLRLSKRIRWGSQWAEISWVTQNQLDEDYPDYKLPVKGNPVLVNRRVSWLRFQVEY